MYRLYFQHTERTKKPSRKHLFVRYCVSACASSPFRFQYTRYLSLCLCHSVWLTLRVCVFVSVYWCWFSCVAALSDRKNHVLHAYGVLLLLLLLSLLLLLLFSNCHRTAGCGSVAVAYAFNDSYEPIGTVLVRACFVWNGIIEWTWGFLSFELKFLYSV